MVNVTLATKKQIIEASATGFQRKGKIFKKIEKRDKSKKVSSRPVKYEKIEVALRSWIKSLKKLEIPLTGPLLKEKAKDLAQEFNIKDFKASNGWLCGFQQRYSISLKNFYRKQPMELGEVEELLNAEMCCSEDELEKENGELETREESGQHLSPKKEVEEMITEPSFIQLKVKSPLISIEQAIESLKLLSRYVWQNPNEEMQKMCDRFNELLADKSIIN